MSIGSPLDDELAAGSHAPQEAVAALVRRVDAISARLCSVLDELEHAGQIDIAGRRWLANVVRSEVLSKRERKRLQHEHIIAAYRQLAHVPERKRLQELRREVQMAEIAWKRYASGAELPPNPVRAELVKARRFGVLPTTTRGLRGVISKEEQNGSTLPFACALMGEEKIDYRRGALDE